MNIVLLGAPASGKGTQAVFLAKEFNLYHLQTGAIARQLAKKDKRIKQIVQSGKLIPEEEMTMYVIDYLNNNYHQMKNILFEGFPRFVSQYEALSSFLKTKGDDIDLVITLDISEEEAVKRISNRRICEKCGEVYNLITNPPPKKGCKCGGKLVQRKDDTPKVIRTRFVYYRDNTQKLIDYLDQEGILVHVDGERSIEQIKRDLVEIINNAKDNN